jgi:hypothetical protein
MSEYLIELKVAEVVRDFGILILVMPLMIYLLLFLFVHNKKKDGEEKSFLYSFSNELLTIFRTFIMIIISLFILTLFNLIKFEAKEYFKKTENSQKNRHDFYRTAIKNGLSIE